MPLGIITLEDVLEGIVYSSPLVPLFIKLTLNLNLELIGEEIYDEFDQQGARGDPYKVPPIQDEKPSETVLGIEASTSKTAPVLPVHMPTTLRGLGGFGFLRARSTPPVPGEETDLHVDAHAPTAVYDPEDGKTHGPSTQSPANMEIPEPLVGTNRQVSTIVVQKDNSSTPAFPSETMPIPLPVAAGTEGKTKSLPLSTIPPSRTTVPAPPLETALLERKRRLVGTASRPSSPVGSTVNLIATGASAAPAIAPVRGAHMKGSRFKSSPLGTGDSAGVERVNEGGRGAAGANEVEEKEVKGGDEEGRMLGEMHKDGLDK
jgi:metal transporter CNNM